MSLLSRMGWIKCHLQMAWLQQWQVVLTSSSCNPNDFLRGAEHLRIESWIIIWLWWMWCNIATIFTIDGDGMQQIIHIFIVCDRTDPSCPSNVPSSWECLYVISIWRNNVIKIKQMENRYSWKPPLKIVLSLADDNVHDFCVFYGQNTNENINLL